jgi:hypothetical protein
MRRDTGWALTRRRCGPSMPLVDAAGGARSVAAARPRSPFGQSSQSGHTLLQNGEKVPVRPAVALRVASRPQTLSGRPHRRGVRWARHAAPALVVPACWWVGRSLAIRPRAVTPGGPPEDGPAGGDQHPARIGDRQGPQMHLLAQVRRRPSVHPADLRLALPGVPHPRPAVLQPRRPAVSGARHRAAGGGAQPAVAGQGDDEGRHCPGTGAAMTLTAGERRRGGHLGVGATLPASR